MISRTPEQIVENNIKGKTILVVEDTLFMRQLIKELIESEGGHAIEAATGTEALEKMKHKPDLAIIDFQLPDLSGIEVLQEIRRQKYATATIMVTADTSQQLAVQWFREGGNDFILKPFDRAFFILIVNRTLLHTEAMREYLSKRGKRRTSK